MLVDDNHLYDRYLTAFTCAATGAVAHSLSTGFSGVPNMKAQNPEFPYAEAAEIEIAQALGTQDGMACRQDASKQIIRGKARLLAHIEQLLTREFPDLST